MTIQNKKEPQTAEDTTLPPQKKSSKKTGVKTKKKNAKQAKTSSAKTRKARPYPASSFKDALVLGEAIMKHAAGEKVRRLTLLQKMEKSPTSSTTQMMITNSGKYGVTTGSYAAEHLSLTEKGKIVVDPQRPLWERMQASFDLAMDAIPPFKFLYEHYKDKRLPEREVMKDFIKDTNLDVSDLDECVDTFTVNAKDLDLLRTIGGAETLVSIEQVIEETINKADNSDGKRATKSPISPEAQKVLESGTATAHDWQKICFYITPIGEEDSEQRKHSDLFMSSLVRPALDELGLTVIRADQIGEPGMITTQILECLKRSKLAIADLSYLNPNVLYEVALRHALRLPVVQLIRKADRLPFDVGQTRTLVFDTSDIYSLVPKLQIYRSEIASQCRKALEDPESVGNPVSIFYPEYYK